MSVDGCILDAFAYISLQMREKVFEKLAAEVRQNWYPHSDKVILIRHI